MQNKKNKERAALIKKSFAAFLAESSLFKHHRKMANSSNHCKKTAEKPVMNTSRACPIFNPYEKQETKNNQWLDQDIPEPFPIAFEEFNDDDDLFFWE